MSFRAQIGVTAMFAGGVLLIGVLKFSTASGQGASPFIAMGTFILVTGVWARAVARRRWLLALAQPDGPSADAMGRLLNGPFGGMWMALLHVNRDGRPRE